MHMYMHACPVATTYTCIQVCPVATVCTCMDTMGKTPLDLATITSKLVYSTENSNTVQLSPLESKEGGGAKEEEDSISKCLSDTTNTP